MVRRKRSPGQQAARSSRLKFEHRLVLANWMLDLFGVSTFEAMAKHMRDPAFEGFNEDNVSRFHQCLKLLFDRPELPNDLLLAYDENIVRHWKAITKKCNSGGQRLNPKYFQYLISNTRLPEVSWWGGGMTKEEFEERHVLFMQEDRAMYIEKMLSMAMA